MHMTEGGAAPPTPRKPTNLASKLGNAHGKKPRGLLPKCTATALVQVNTSNTSAARKRRQLRQLPGGRRERFPVRLLGVLHDGGETMDSRSGKEQHNSAQEGITQGDLALLAPREVVQPPQTCSRAQGPGRTAALARPAIPTRDTPSLTGRSAQDHNHPPPPGHIQPAGSTSAAGQVTQGRVDGDVKADDPNREGSLGDGAIKPELEVARPALTREEMQHVEYTVIEEAVQGNRGYGGMAIPEAHRGERGNLISTGFNRNRGQNTPLHRDSRAGGSAVIFTCTPKLPGIKPVPGLSSLKRGRVTRLEKGSVSRKALRSRVHEMPEEPGTGVELLAAATANSAQCQGPGRVQVTVSPGTMCTPSSDSRQSVAAIVAQVSANRLRPGRTLRQAQTPSGKDLIKAAAPQDA